MKFVIVESPFGKNPDGSQATPLEMERNVRYARRALRDCFERGEIPFASHLLYPQCLDDRKPEQRKQGMQAGFRIAEALATSRLLIDVYCAMYVDHGITSGMREGCAAHGLRLEQRTIGEEPLGELAPVRPTPTADEFEILNQAFVKYFEDSCAWQPTRRAASRALDRARTVMMRLGAWDEPLSVED